MRLLKDVAVPVYLKMYHKDAYPDDGNWDDWYYSFAPVRSADQYILLIKYRQKPGQGDLYSTRTYDSLYLVMMNEPELLEKLRSDFDQMRVEIIETLDGLVERKKADPFDWKQQMNFKKGVQSMIWIPLRAVAKQRARLTRPRRGRKSRAYTPQPTVHFENGVAEHYVANGGTHHGKIPLGISIEIHKDGFSVEVFPLECSVRPVGVRGDVDNICKSVLDGLNGVAWDDDRQVELMTVHFVGIPRKGTEYEDVQQMQTDPAIDPGVLPQG